MVVSVETVKQAVFARAFSIAACHNCGSLKEQETEQLTYAATVIREA